VNKKEFQLRRYLGLISPMFYLQLFADPKSAKRQLSHQCLFTLLGSAQVKVARKALVKLTPSAGIRALFVNNGI